MATEDLYTLKASGRNGGSFDINFFPRILRHMLKVSTKCRKSREPSTEKNIIALQFSTSTFKTQIHAKGNANC